MTKFRFSAGPNMRLACVAMLAVALGLSGCGGDSYGTAAAGFFMPQISDVYIPLEGGNIFVGEGDGAAVVIAPGVAVTAAHNAIANDDGPDVVDDASILGASKDRDLLYFRTTRTATLPTATPVDGEAVIAYGQGAHGSLRVSHGVISKLWADGLGFVCDAGPGFSGGPVVDAKTGALVGITYGYLDQPGSAERLMIAYNMTFVASEYAGLKVSPKPSPDRNNR
jgi:S1-C subfamily serine protease